MGYGVWDSGFGVRGSGFGVSGVLGLEVDHYDVAIALLSNVIRPPHLPQYLWLGYRLRYRFLDTG